MEGVGPESLTPGTDRDPETQPDGNAGIVLSSIAGSAAVPFGSEPEELFALFAGRYRIYRTPEGCWQWEGATSEGYATLRRKGRTYLVHRLVYEEVTGPIPPGRQIDHLCRNRSCLNPAHMEVVTPRENTLRGEGVTAQNARKTHCPRGHPYNEGNTVLRARGGRGCRTCQREWSRRRYQRHGNRRRPRSREADPAPEGQETGRSVVEPSGSY